MQTLKLFLSLVELRNLTHAARRHAISPSAVTKRIQELEQHYGVLLFERQSRGVVPTIAGEELARQYGDLLGRMTQIRATMSEFAKGARGQVSVHASASTLLEGLAATIAAFTRENPGVRVDLHELMSWKIVRNVVEGRADVGFVAASVEVPEDLTTLFYRQDQIMALLPTGHELSSRDAVGFQELLDFDQVGIELTSALSVQLAEEAERLNRQLRPKYRAATYDVVRKLVSEGCGLAILPNSLMPPEPASLGLQCIPLTDPWARREMRLCFRESALTVAARLFIAAATSAGLSGNPI